MLPGSCPSLVVERIDDTENQEFILIIFILLVLILLLASPLLLPFSLLSGRAHTTPSPEGMIGFPDVPGIRLSYGTMPGIVAPYPSQEFRDGSSLIPLPLSMRNESQIVR